MVEKEFTSDEVLKDIIGEPIINGFRKGVTKKSLIKSLDEDDWKFLDRVKQADDLKTNGESLAYKIFVKNDQLYQQYTDIRINIPKLIADGMQIKEIMTRNEVDITAGKTEQKDEQGTHYTMRELEIANMKLDGKMRKTIKLVIAELSKLFTYVGRIGLDRKKFFNEAEYEIIAENAVAEFKKLGYELL